MSDYPVLSSTPGTRDTDVAGATPDTITELITPGGATSGQTTLRVTVTDAGGSPRVGALVMLAHYAAASSIPTTNLGTEVVKAPGTSSFSGTVFAITDGSGRAQWLFSAPSATVTTCTVHVFSAAPHTQAITPFTAP